MLARPFMYGAGPPGIIPPVRLLSPSNMAAGAFGANTAAEIGWIVG